MALDDDDTKAIAKMINDSTKALVSKLEGKLADALTAKLDETVSAKLDAQAKRAEKEAADADKAGKDKEADPERKTMKERLAFLEEQAKRDGEEKQQLKKQAQQERENTAFRSAWSAQKLIPDLADDHLAALRASNRLSQGEDGVLRVLDPKQDKYGQHPSLEEYATDLAKSEKGRFYQPGSNAHGGPAPNGVGAGVSGKPAHMSNALSLLLTGTKD